MASISAEECGEVTISSKTGYEIEWKIPDFLSLLEKYEQYFSAPFSFAGAIWMMALIQKSGYLVALFIRKSTIPPISMKISLGFKALNGNKDRERSAKRVTVHGFEVYRWLQCLETTKLLERKVDLLPSHVLTMLFTLELQKATEDAGGIAKVTCSHSKDVMDATAISSHEKKCLNQPIQCPEGSTVLILNNWYGHECPLDKAEDGTAKVTCSHCKDVMDATAISFHEKKCLNKPIKCPECSSVVILKNWFGHECPLDKSEGGIAKVTCSLCKDVMDATAISSHKTKCLNKPIKCPECLTVTTLKNWYNHECPLDKPDGEAFTSASTSNAQDSRVLKDLKDFYLKQKNCDLVMRVRGHEFLVHKTILEARSPAFTSAFGNDMERVTGVLDIEDCDPNSFSDFLCFLYCGDNEIISKENVLDLFMTARKFGVEDLKSQCVNFMKDYLSFEPFSATFKKIRFETF